MKKPNFFIIGAPKCGTTSMAAWLSEHPNIYMSPVKEPHYFSKDIIITSQYNSIKSYEALFKYVREEHIAIGEASTEYLYSRIAVPKILEYNPDSRFVVMIRNPIEMVHSLHDHEVYCLHEDVSDFERAWRLQEDRRSGRSIPRFCPDPQILLYGKRCMIGEQVERLYKLVSKERVLILLQEDLKKDPRNEYMRVLQFIQVPDDGRENFPTLNTAKEHRNQFLGRVVKTVSIVKRRLGIPRLRTGILDKINLYNTKVRRRPQLQQEIRNELIEYYKEDINKLSFLLNRDLSHWMG